MKKNILVGVIGIILFIGVIAHFTTPNTAVEGIQTVAPTANPTSIPTDTPAPTDTPIPVYNTSNSSQSYPPQDTQQQTCAGATASCNDGTCSYSAHHQGTCSHHGGVAQWYQ